MENINSTDNKFRMGDHVRVPQYDKTATVEDILYSNKLDTWLYTVRFDDSPVDFGRPLAEDEIEGVKENASYRFEISQQGALVTARMLKTVDGEEKEVAAGHAWVRSEDDLGYAQAASYAAGWIFRLIKGEGN